MDHCIWQPSISEGHVFHYVVIIFIYSFHIIFHCVYIYHPFCPYYSKECVYYEWIGVGWIDSLKHRSESGCVGGLFIPFGRLEIAPPLFEQP